MSAARCEERDVLLSIRGTQRDEDGEDQVMELTTAGRLWNDEGVLCLSYVETEMTGMKGVRTTFRVEDGGITMVREGELRSTMVFVEGERSESLYDLGFAALLLRVTARRVRADIREDSGRLELSYSVELERRMVASHNYEIEYRPLNQKPLPPA